MRALALDSRHDDCKVLVLTFLKFTSICCPFLFSGGLALTPRSGLVLGGTQVEISGPCFNVTSDTVVCRFNGNILADGNVVDRYKASCVTPHLRDIGRVSLEMSLDDGKNFNFSSQFTSG